MNIESIKILLLHYEINSFPYRRCAMINLIYNDIMKYYIMNCYDCNYCNNLIRKYTT